MNLANSLTLLRMFLSIPLFTLLVFEQWKVAFFLFVFGALTDYFDGLAARKLKQMTDFGKVFDQIADKVFVSSTMIAMIPMIPRWLVALVIARDTVISAVRIIAANQGYIIQANIYGKVKTAVQMILLIEVLFAAAFRVDFGWLTVLMIYLCALLTVLSLFLYVYQNKKTLGGSK